MFPVPYIRGVTITNQPQEAEAVMKPLKLLFPKGVMDCFLYLLAHFLLPEFLPNTGMVGGERKCFWCPTRGVPQEGDVRT